MFSSYAERQIRAVQQYRGEHLIDYMNYFDSLLEKYPDHGLNEYNILHIFLCGMDPAWYERLQCAAGYRRLEDLGLREVWDLIDYVAGIVRTSDHQQDQENMEEILADIRELKKQVSQMLENQEAERLEREQEEQKIDEGKEATMDHDPLTSVVIQELEILPFSSDLLSSYSLQVSRPYDREDLVLLSDVRTRVSNNGPITKNVSIRSVPHEKRSSGTYKKIPEELDWEGTQKELPFKRCQQKKYVEILKYDHTYPWEPGL